VVWCTELAVTGGTGGSGIGGFGLNYKNKVFGGSQINTAGQGVAGKSG
jgi:hypothetical protein